MVLPPSFRRLALTVHVVSSVGWLGALAVFMAHAAAGVMSADEQTVRAVYVVMGLTAWVVILPLSVASLISGLVQALGTAWGLFRHYWVIVKLVLTVIATAVLLLKLGPIAAIADAAAQATFGSGDLMGSRTSLLVHSVGGLAILLAAATLAIYKPSGMTRYGLRSQHASVSAADGSDVFSVATPMWVKLCGVLVFVLVLLISVMLFGAGMYHRAIT